VLVRGIRGAVTVAHDSAEEVLAATRELLQNICQLNEINPEEITSVIFSATPDIKSAFPALAARQMGWDHVPLFCCQEMGVENSLALCIRVLLHVNTDKKASEIKHVYLGEARKLRPDLAGR